MNENKKQKNQFVGTGYTNNRTVAQPNNEPIINCFYNRPFYPCAFTTTESKLMESHYKKVHYQKEVSRG